MEISRYAVVTALPKEFAAVCAAFDSIIEPPFGDLEIRTDTNDPNDYSIGVIETESFSRYLVPIVLLKKMGNNSAAAACANLFRSFPTVDNVLMVGIAGGIPNAVDASKHVRLGDIVVSRGKGLIQYDNVKVKGRNSIEIRDTSSPPGADLTGIINRLEAKSIGGSRPWEEHIARVSRALAFNRPSSETDVLASEKGVEEPTKHPEQPQRHQGQPLVHYGAVGSANTLLKSALKRNELSRKLGILAVEMEGSGLADGSWIAGKHYLLVRGICDYADKNKNDLWQGYAAACAAGYARAVLDASRSSDTSTNLKKNALMYREV